MEELHLRQRQEAWEETFLHPLAQRSGKSRGREVPEEECEVRTSFQRDRDRIIHSKAFRRLKHKTQVFLSPEGDHYRTRLTHTLEVAQIARTIARAFRLNEDLTEAIALGHDLGHTPFGHTGEQVLNEIYPGGFRHNEQSQRVVELLETRSPRYRGLNLTWEVRDGIRKHTGPELPRTLEGQIVRYADRIAYLNHDVDDAIRAGVLDPGSLPEECIRVLGGSGSIRIDRMVKDILHRGIADGRIGMTPEVQSATDRLRAFLFDRIYLGSAAKQEEGKARKLVESLYLHFTRLPGDIPEEYRPEPGADVERAVADYIAGMTDRYAISEFRRLFLPKAWEGV